MHAMVCSRYAEIFAFSLVGHPDSAKAVPEAGAGRSWLMEQKHYRRLCGDAAAPSGRKAAGGKSEAAVPFWPVILLNVFEIEMLGCGVPFWSEAIAVRREELIDPVGLKLAAQGVQPYTQHLGGAGLDPAAGVVGLEDVLFFYFS
jgi:hypothetical protein